MDKPRRRDDIVFRQIGPDDACLYDPVERNLHVLNPTAALIWQLADGGHTKAQIAAELGLHFDVPEGVDLQSDVEGTLDLFGRLGVLVQETGGR